MGRIKEEGLGVVGSSSGFVNTFFVFGGGLFFDVVTFRFVVNGWISYFVNLF